jgi:hypothetical protein
MKRVRFIAGLVAMLTLGFVGSAKADSITIDGVKFVGTVSGTMVTLTVTCTEPSCANYAIGSITLKQGFTFTGTATNFVEPLGYGVQNGGQNNGGSTNCDKTQLQSAVCWNASGAFFAIGSGLTFEASIANGTLGTDPLHVQTVIFSDSTGNSRITGVSNDLTGGTITTPEPASLMFLGLGLLGVPFLRRKK